VRSLLQLLRWQLRRRCRRHRVLRYPWLLLLQLVLLPQDLLALLELQLRRFDEAVLNALHLSHLHLQHHLLLSLRDVAANDQRGLLFGVDGFGRALNSLERRPKRDATLLVRQEFLRSREA